MEFSLEGGDVADELLVLLLLLDKIEETENMLGFFGTIGVVVVLVIVSCNLQKKYGKLISRKKNSTNSNQTCSLAKGWKCHILTSYQMWFCQKLLKNAKRKTVTIWRFFEKTSGSLNFGVLPDLVLAKNCSKMPKKNGSCSIWRYQMWISQKSPNLDHNWLAFLAFF